LKVISGTGTGSGTFTGKGTKMSGNLNEGTGPGVSEEASPFTVGLLEFELSMVELLSEPDPGARWERAFGSRRPIRVEIGVGNSNFLIEVALREPGYNYLGFEYSRKRVVKFLKRVQAREVKNIRILRVNAAPVLASLLGPGSVDHFFINFPDPWPKRRHAKHRLIQPAHADNLARLLAAGGGISLRSDSPAYAAQMLSVMDGIPELENASGRGCFAAIPRDEIPTPYEVKYRKEGRSIFYLEYRKKKGQPDRGAGTGAPR